MGERQRIGSGGPWEARYGYSRAIRAGNRVLVAGTTAVGPDGELAGAGDAGAQARRAFATALAALREAGGTAADVVRTRMYVVDIGRDGDAVGRVHGELFAEARPAATMVEVRALIDPAMLVEVELEAELPG